MLVEYLWGIRGELSGGVEGWRERERVETNPRTINVTGWLRMIEGEAIQWRGLVAKSPMGFNFLLNYPFACLFVIEEEKGGGLKRGLIMPPIFFLFRSMIIILDRWWKYRDGERIIIENYNERIKSFSLTYHIYISDDCFQRFF